MSVAAPTDAAIHIATDRQQVLDRLQLSGKQITQQLLQRMTSVCQHLNRLAASQAPPPHREITTRRLLNESSATTA